MNIFTNEKEFPLLIELKEAVLKSKNIYFVVSFIKESGVKLLKSDFDFALNSGATIKIITSDYLNITEPNALYKLLFDFNNKIQIKIIDTQKIKSSFHTKCYIFEYKNCDSENGEGEIIIGSSNLSKTALIDGIEWNYKITQKTNNNDYLKFKEYFNDLYDNYSVDLTVDWLRKYQENYKINTFFDENFEQNNNFNTEIIPVNFQIPALFELKKTREENYNKGLVIAATGVGKTFLAAFDSLNFNKILFVAHREEILIQAKESFEKIYFSPVGAGFSRPSSGIQSFVSKNISPVGADLHSTSQIFDLRGLRLHVCPSSGVQSFVSQKKSFGFFMNDKKDYNCDILFASIQTLGKSEYLEKFDKNYFDYIVIDEFHHSAAKSYEKLLNRFTPKFLLGLTATPDRNDNKDIYKYCDYNIVYNCNFKVAINNGWLVPFKYYGIYDDEIDYNKIKFNNGKYDETELDSYLMQIKRSEKIINYYNVYKNKKAIAFCSSIKHCNFTQEQFKKNNINAKSLTSENNKERKEIINDFKSGKTEILCVVDIFNEGVDVPDVDLVMFLRPTESFTIFIQQLGRGLRKNKNKEYLTFTLPLNCTANFDLKLIDLFAKLKNKSTPIKEKLKEEYFTKTKTQFCFSDNMINELTMLSNDELLSFSNEFLLRINFRLFDYFKRRC